MENERENEKVENEEQQEVNEEIVEEERMGDLENEQISVEGVGKKNLMLKEAQEFEDMGLRIDILRGVYSYGFEKPSLIQQKGIVIFTSGEKVDLIAQAQSGTGKTATFLLSMMQNLDDESEELQGLILVPTHELATQTIRRFLPLAEFTKYRTHCCIGGTKVWYDEKVIKEKRPQFVVGTPGRIKHLIAEGLLPVNHLKMLVLDEADLLLDIGFHEQIYEIFTYLPKGLQIGLFSATMPPAVVKLAEQFMDDPVKILLKEEKLTLEGIKQFFVDVGDDRNKYVTLVDLYTRLTIARAIIFCNSKKKVDELAKRLNDDDHTVSKIHSDLDDQREEIMRDFRKGTSRILVATDIVGRGIDVHQVSLVINYDIPRRGKKESYIHRIGRSGRFGRKGVAINFVTQRDYRDMREIERFYRTTISPLPKDINKLL